MSEFDPSQPARVHGQLNDDTFIWEPERHGADWRRYPPRGPDARGVVDWDGLELDGWEPLQ
jgi:hypothetical protein